MWFFVPTPYPPPPLPASGNLYPLKAQANIFKKESLVQVFSCEFCEISKGTISYRTSLVAASGDIVLEGFIKGK